jgi:hypothetical protein
MWRFETGVFHQGPRQGEPGIPREIAPGELALLTTRLPEEPEEARRIFGIFTIASLDYGDDRSYYVQGDPARSLRLPSDSLLRYWDFKRGSIDWRTHLYRHVDSDEAAAVFTP